MLVFEVIVWSVMLVGFVMSLFIWNRWHWIQLAIICAVLATEGLWHWSPPMSNMALYVGIGLAAFVTAVWSDIQAWRRGERRSLVDLFGLRWRR